jgi:hypothetical protein
MQNISFTDFKGLAKLALADFVESHGGQKAITEAIVANMYAGLITRDNARYIYEKLATTLKWTEREKLSVYEYTDKAVVQAKYNAFVATLSPLPESQEKSDLLMYLACAHNASDKREWIAKCLGLTCYELWEGYKRVFHHLQAKSKVKSLEITIFKAEQLGVNITAVDSRLNSKLGGKARAGQDMTDAIKADIKRLREIGASYEGKESDVNAFVTLYIEKHYPNVFGTTILELCGYTYKSTSFLVTMRASLKKGKYADVCEFYSVDNIHLD